MLFVPNELDLTPVFDLPVGYHSAAWVDLTGDTVVSDRPLLTPLDQFVAEVHAVVHREGIQRWIGAAYMRVIDGERPENYMRWHVDPLDDAYRFHTAIATDDASVNLAWPVDQATEGRKVEDSWTDVEYVQPPNGELIVFTTEVHGVLPQPVRPGQRTAIFFATLYRDRQAADLYTTNNTQTESHAMLPALEPTR